MVRNYADAEAHCRACVLLFSGGRDSTVAAARLVAEYERVVLLTVSTSHLFGIERVRSRLTELRPLPKGSVEWMHVGVSPGTLKAIEGDLMGCLTCQHAYVAVAVKVAEELGINHIALGYTAYQGGWLEQSPYAVTRLTEILAAAGKTLLLPASDLGSKQQAKFELRLLNLSEDALEQKCARQQTNDVTLNEEGMRAQIDRWAESLRSLLVEKNQIEFRVLESRSVEVAR